MSENISRRIFLKLLSTLSALIAVPNSWLRPTASLNLLDGLVHAWPGDFVPGIKAKFYRRALSAHEISVLYDVERDLLDLKSRWDLYKAIPEHWYFLSS